MSTDRFTMLATLLVAFTVRLLGLASQELWYDELQTVTLAILPLPDLLASVREFDAHPPLYYAQLHFWLYGGTSDIWIKFNSVLWSLITVASLFAIGRKYFGASVGTLAALLFALFPFAIAYAQEARMYALLMVLGIWIFFFTDRLLYGPRPMSAAGGLLSTTLLFLYSHGAGFLIFFSVTTYVLYTSWAGVQTNVQLAPQPNRRRRLTLWLLVQLLLLLYYGPWLYRAASVSVRHTLKPDLPAITNTLSLLVLGFGEIPLLVRWGTVAIVVVLLLTLFFTHGDSRALMLAFVVVPVFVTLAISYLYRPIWLHRPLAYTLPFLALALALAMNQRIAAFAHHTSGIFLQRAIALFFGLLLLVAAANQQARIYYPWRIRDAAQMLQQVTTTNECIYVLDYKLFWGINWYFTGPGTINPLQPEAAWTNRNGVLLTADGRFTGSCKWWVYRTMDLPPAVETSEFTALYAFDDLLVAQRW